MSVENSYTRLDNSKSKGFESSSTAFGYDKNLVIGGVNFGKKWTDADAAALQHMQLQANTDLQLQMIEDERQYNSPEEQAKRMRAAGLNPNLVGLEGAEHKQSISGGVGSPSGQPAGADTDRIVNFVGRMVDMLPTAISIAQSIKTHSLDNALKQADLEKLARGEALSLIGQNVTLDDLLDKTSVPHVSTNHIANRKYRNLVNKNLDSFLLDAGNRDAAIASVYTVKGDKANKRLGYLKDASEVGNDPDELFISCLKELFDFEIEAKKETSKYNRDFYSNTSGKDVAETNKTIREAEKTNATTEANSMDKKWQQKLTELWDSDDKGDNFKAGILYILSKLSGSLSVGPKGTTKSFGF